MVVQNFDVRTTSQHTFMSSQGALSENQTKTNRGLDFDRLLQAHRQSQDDVLDLLSSKRKPEETQCIPEQDSVRNKNMPVNLQELRSQFMKLIFELLFSRFGRKSEYSESFSFEMNFAGSYFGVSGAGNTAGIGWQGEQFRFESEQVSFQAHGIVNTLDGKTINVDINMYMSRQFTLFMNIDVLAAQSQLCDPLVINYGGTSASLTGETFMFDLTSDGNMENLASLGDGSGFLAIDKNGDGIINNGSELFGPNSGCGFSELRVYDADGNGWIDEADEVFDNLVVWTRNPDGTDTSHTLRELGIGAIYLGNIATEFSFKDDANETLGVMRSTSFFLKENGGGGTISHIDLSYL